MRNIVYKKYFIPNEIDIENLYNDANWTIYTNDLPNLIKAIRNSLFIVTAWDKEKLIGLIRVIGDGVTIIYIQDILVFKTYKRKGIGTNLINIVCEEYKAVRQKVLLTNDTPETRGFYESLGFTSCDKGELVSFVRLK